MIIDHVFIGADMRKGHDGLNAAAKERKVNLKDLEPQHGVVFMNRKRDRMKLYGAGHILCYMRASDIKRPFDIKACDYFYLCFDKHGKLDYDKALKMRLEDFMAGKGKKAVDAKEMKKL